MSMIMRQNSEGRTSIQIYEPSAELFFDNMNFDDTDIEITGESGGVLFSACRFSGCKITADNLSAFHSCYFENDCEFLAENLPLVDLYIEHKRMEGRKQSVNNNLICTKE